MATRLEIQGGVPLSGTVAVSAAKNAALPVAPYELVSTMRASVLGQGAPEISRVYHLDRGYDRLETTLAGLGAKIVRLA